MKKYIIGAGILLSAWSARAQVQAPVKWAYAAKKLNANEAVVYLKADIDKGWHIYSQHVADGGPVKTSFAFAKSDEYTLVNKTTEPQPKKKFERAFDMNVTYFENTVVFQQKVKLNKSNPTVKGTLNYMVCSDKECLPPEEVTFAIDL